MLTKDGPKVIEFNCRFGDPETQVVLPRLKTDLVEIIKKSVEKNIKDFEIELIEDTAITVVLASKGYPGSFEKQIILPLLNEFENLEDITIYHSGTSINGDKKLVSDGGRVLCVTSLGSNIQSCREKAYEVINKLNWDKGFYRKDIGKL